MCFSGEDLQPDEIILVLSWNFFSLLWNCLYEVNVSKYLKNVAALCHFTCFCPIKLFHKFLSRVVNCLYKIEILRNKNSSRHNLKCKNNIKWGYEITSGTQKCPLAVLSLSTSVTRRSSRNVTAEWTTIESNSSADD